MRRVTGLVAIVLVASACGGSAATTTTAAASIPVSSVAPSAQEAGFLAMIEAAVGPTDPSASIVLGHAICRSLRLFSAAAVAPPIAADALRTVDMRQIPADGLPTYGAALVAAPQTLCSDVVRYGDEVTYWLGI